MALNALTTIALLALLIGIPYQTSSAQSSTRFVGSDSVVVIPSEKYKAGWLHRIFFGDHWRELWSSPIKVPILDLEKFAGGLKPIRKGGGYQTKSLRFQGSDGKQYKFRSLDKDPTKILPKPVQNTVVSDVIQDQISTANPISALIVAPMVNELGILQADPFLCVLPDSPILGEFQEVFANLLGTLEEHPNEGDDGEEGFAGATKVMGTYKFYDRLEERNNEIVSGPEFLKARLIDIFLGDWDRHNDQWRWARFSENDQKVWKPIPRDRDQAFSRYDGLFPWITSVAIRQLQNFTENYPNMEFMTWSGRHLDRRFLTSLTKHEWDSVTTIVNQGLTDELIERSVARMPREWFAMEGERLIRELKARRDKLSAASEEFFYYIKEVIDIHMSDEPEYAEVKRTNDKLVDISIYNRSTKSGEKKGKALYHHVVNCDLTKEVRIYMKGGDDYVEISGDVDNSVRIRVIGGEGKDELVDRSIVHGHLFGFIPFVPSAEVLTYFYDADDNTQFIEGAGTAIDQTRMPKPKDWLEKYESDSRDRGHDWRFGPRMGFDSDNGIIVGGGPIVYEYSFRNDPWVYRMDLLGAIAPSVDRFSIDYTADVYQRIARGTRWYTHLGISSLQRLNFFGIGNETERVSTLSDSDYYKVFQTQYYLNTSLEFPILEDHAFRFSAGLKHVEHERPDDSDSTLALDGQTRPPGIEDIALFTVGGSFKFDSRDYELAATKGIFFQASAAYTPEVFNNPNAFTRVKGEFRAYGSTNFIRPMTLAVRASAEKIWGDFPFFEGAFLGGTGNLRGFERERFLGDAAILAAAELRVELFETFILFPGKFGILGGTETGRVFLESEDSDKWHPAVGAGVWMNWVDPAFTVSISLYESSEEQLLYIQGGFGF